MPDDDRAIEDFARQLRGEVNDRIASNQIDGWAENVFTQLVLDELELRADIEEGLVCYSEKMARRALAKINGFGINEDQDVLDLFYTIWRDEGQSTSLTREDVHEAVRQADRYGALALAGTLLTGAETSHPDYAMLQRIHEVAAGVTRARLFVLSNVRLTNTQPFSSTIGGKPATIEVWDVVRILRARQSGAGRNSIEIDLAGELGAPLPCLPLPRQADGYAGFLVIVPGELLHRLYDSHGERLLELNVRSFLQARGKVNQAIRETLRTAPASFFAYNNGLSAVAEEVEVIESPQGKALGHIRGLQIVNGGQTTASIHRAKKKDGATLEHVFVQMKLVVVPPESIELIVPKISRNANSQNKVNDADFSANDPFHRRIEELSRSVWAPGQRDQWFYERARGQYQVAKAKAPAGFESRYPARKMFTKTDLAASENSWEQQPHVVSRGGQKNFLQFMLDNEAEHAQDKVAELDAAFFQRLVARLMVFRRTQLVVRQLQFQAYRANIVTYSVAFLSRHVSALVDLDRIWREQDVPQTLVDSIRDIAIEVDRAIKESAGARNVTEWCKKEDCWKHIRALRVTLPKAFWSSSGSARRGREVRVETRSVESETIVVVDSSMPTLAALAEQGYEIIDLREQDGDLWVVGDASLRPVMATLARKGLTFAFVLAGADATGKRPGWRLRP